MAEEQKKSGRWLGFLAIVLAILLAVIAVAMYIQIQGTKLLYIDATLGKIYRFYWIPLVIAAILLTCGLFILEKHPKQGEKQVVAETTQSEQSTQPTQAAVVESKTPMIEE